MPSIFVIGGPNGAGKTTSAMSLLPNELECREFVNADSIAAGLSPFHPDEVAIQAGRLMLERIRRLASERADFAFETTMASRSFVPFLRKCRKDGYSVHALFLWLPNAELALQRIAHRVKEGGHDVPDTVVRRRYILGIDNFINMYIPVADTWALYDNSGSRPQRIAGRDDTGRPFVDNADTWQSIQDAYV